MAFPGEKVQTLEKQMVGILKLMWSHLSHILLVMNGI